jgi:hypothetical protein
MRSTWQEIRVAISRLCGGILFEDTPLVAGFGYLWDELYKAAKLYLPLVFTNCCRLPSKLARIVSFLR